VAQHTTTDVHGLSRVFHVIDAVTSRAAASAVVFGAVVVFLTANPSPFGTASIAVDRPEIMAGTVMGVMGNTMGNSWATRRQNRSERPPKGPLTRNFMERTTRFELATLTLAKK
jgi:hypothetical protein